MTKVNLDRDGKDGSYTLTPVSTDLTLSGHEMLKITRGYWLLDLKKAEAEYQRGKFIESKLHGNKKKLRKSK